MSTVAYKQNQDWALTTSNSYEIDVQDNFYQDINFGLVPNTLTSELTPILASAPTRCGFTVPFWLDCQNSGTTFSSGLIALEIDDLTALESAVPEPDSINGNKLFWVVDNLAPTYNERINLLLKMPGFEYFGAVLNFKITSFIEDMSGDYQVSMADTYTSVVTCAYDPNDKLVLPEGIGEKKQTLFDQGAFEYTIRFQNTGNDTAFTVRLEDQLDEDLDWNTFQPITASHDYEVTLSDGGLLIFLFENILLPDSTTNEPESHGFAKFRILPKENLPEGTEITNSAGIFFDFNPPILTNTTLNTLVSEILSVNEVQLNYGFDLAPNPALDQVVFTTETDEWTSEDVLQIWNLQGRLIFSQPLSTKTTSIDLSSLPAGAYLVAWSRDGVRLGWRKLIRQ